MILECDSGSSQHPSFMVLAQPVRKSTDRSRSIQDSTAAKRMEGCNAKAQSFLFFAPWRLCVNSFLACCQVTRITWTRCHPVIEPRCDLFLRPMLAEHSLNRGCLVSMGKLQGRLPVVFYSVDVGAMVDQQCGDGSVVAGGRII